MKKQGDWQFMVSDGRRPDRGGWRGARVPDPDVGRRRKAGGEVLLPALTLTTRAPAGWVKPDGESDPPLRVWLTPGTVDGVLPPYGELSPLDQRNPFTAPFEYSKSLNTTRFIYLKAHWQNNIKPYYYYNGSTANASAGARKWSEVEIVEDFSYEENPTPPEGEWPEYFILKIGIIGIGGGKVAVQNEGGGNFWSMFETGTIAGWELVENILTPKYRGSFTVWRQ